MKKKRKKRAIEGHNYFFLSLFGSCVTPPLNHHHEIITSEDESKETKEIIITSACRIVDSVVGWSYNLYCYFIIILFKRKWNWKYLRNDLRWEFLLISAEWILQKKNLRSLSVNSMDDSEKFAFKMCPKMIWNKKLA